MMEGESTTTSVTLQDSEGDENKDSEGDENYTRKIAKVIKTKTEIAKVMKMKTKIMKVMKMNKKIVKKKMKTER